jgi:hypothetical protein
MVHLGVCTIMVYISTGSEEAIFIREAFWCMEPGGSAISRRPLMYCVQLGLGEQRPKDSRTSTLTKCSDQRPDITEIHTILAGPVQGIAINFGKGLPG